MVTCPKTIRLAVFRPGQPATLETVPEKLESYQRIVGGYIEVVFLPDPDLILIANDDMTGQPFNRTVTVQGGKHYIHGTFFVCRQDDPEFTSIDPDDLVRLTAYISNHHVIVIAPKPDDAPPTP